MKDARSPNPAELEKALRESRHLEDAPEHLVRRAIDLWPPLTTRAAVPSPRSGNLRRWLATLRFDSAADDALALGLRAGASRSTRQLLFSAEGRDVDLRLERQPDGRWQIGGQVLGPDTAGVAELRCGRAPLQRVAWSELAEFQFEPVDTGICLLTLISNGWEMDVPAFDLAHNF
jgi:hypothetical protein